MNKPGGSIKPKKTNSHNFLRFVAFAHYNWSQLCVLNLVFCSSWYMLRIMLDPNDMLRIMLDPNGVNTYGATAL